METGQSEMNGSQENTDVLTEVIPKYGRVSLLFYIPETLKDRDTMVKLIRVNGGNIVNYHECFSFQIGTPANTKDTDYFPGTVYSFQWIVESIEAKQLQDKAKYILSNYSAGKEFPFNKKKIQYTIREIIIIYNWISGRKSQASRKTWESLGNDGILYCRSRESLKNFWKKWRKHSLESCIEEMLVKDTKYCHNYATPILPHEELPDPEKKKLKRSKEEVEENEKKSAEDKADPEETIPSQNTIQKKRTLKKKEKEAVKTGESDRVNTSENKTQKVEEIKHVESIVLDESDDQAEHDNEAKKDLEVDDVVLDSEKEKKEIKPNPEPEESKEIPSENGGKEGSHATSELGFPDFEDESEDGGDI